MDQKVYVVRPARDPNMGWAVVEQTNYDNGRTRLGEEVAWATAKADAQIKADLYNADTL